ncbi:S8 family serine peptidase [Paenibacillus pasadenensis]|uniref:S8 family serine peptidase n=1 Tax=Paenibacillus pasadenensis TaxID=217090 RepID=UPI002041EDD0|nr:S8 family serine peptidase [Paenibacillus pasadenensis]MCM3747590.1 S8 family serine peptidase [Paenibacillus pasadenensis]
MNRYGKAPRLACKLTAALAAAGLLAAAPVPAALQAGSFAAPAAVRAGAPAPAPAQQQHSWLQGRRDPGQRTALPGTIVLHRRDNPAVELVAPEPGADPAAWLKRLRATPGVAYVHPNEPVRVLNAPGAAAAKLASALVSPLAAAPSDPGLGKQAYLKQIGAREAWSAMRPQSSVIIAVVDTGVDLDHPDLKSNLLKGVNLQKPGSPPEDDNGHGTSVAGVIAASGNNASGISGILWKAKLLPVKALDGEGYGDEQQLGEGILKAMDKGARIVVLSVGLYHSSPYMKEIVELAERKGVLLVAAAGNDALRFGSKTTVKYPAAYPTVLAVGGVASNGVPEKRSTRGPEVDLAGAWQVYTTEAGGGYHYEEGTSMAAPQAAAAAALLWTKYPSLKPYQIRSLLKQTTKDTAPGGFDSATGYGLLRMEKALKEKYKADPYEPNNKSETAATLPLGKQLSAELMGADSDWYQIDSPFDGVVTLRVRQLLSAGQNPAAIGLRLEQPGGAVEKQLKLSNNNLVWNVKKGANYIRLQHAGNGKARQPYMLTAALHMRADSFEPNEQAEKAAALPDRTQQVRGTFHQLNDRDWYSLRVTSKGTLRIQLDAGTMRIDPAFAYRKAGGAEVTVDSGAEGAAEVSALIDVSPGTYYIRVWDASEPQAELTSGYYTLGLSREKKK